MVRHDLHNHSARSKDGAATAEELIDMAARRGLEGFGLCDHDETPDEGLQDIAAARGVRLALGVEFSCHKTHVIGFNLRPSLEDAAWMEEHFKRLRRNYLAVTRLMIDELNKAGMRVSYDDVAAFAGKPPHKIFLFKYLSERLGMFQSWGQARKCIVKRGLYHPDNTGMEALHPAEAVELIRRCGGVSVWAHPFLTPEPYFSRYFDDMLHAGLDAMEAAYGYAVNGRNGTESDFELRRRALDMCREHGLYASGGSDSHYPLKTNTAGAPIRPGDYGLPGLHEEFATRLYERTPASTPRVSEVSSLTRP